MKIVSRTPQPIYNYSANPHRQSQWARNITSKQWRCNRCEKRWWQLEFGLENYFRRIYLSLTKFSSLSVFLLLLPASTLEYLNFSAVGIRLMDRGRQRLLQPRLLIILLLLFLLTLILNFHISFLLKEKKHLVKNEKVEKITNYLCESLRWTSKR